MGFGNFKPKENLGATGFLDRKDFAGVAPEAAAKRLRDFVSKRRDKVPLTLGSYETVARIVLKDLAEKGIDLASLTPTHMVEYRDYLQQLVDSTDPKERMSENYGVHMTVHWNALMRQSFGAGHVRKGRCYPPCPAEEVTFPRGFTSSKRTVIHLDAADFDKIRQAIADAPIAPQTGQIPPAGSFRNEHWKRTLAAFFELLTETGCRYASGVSVRVCDLDFNKVPARVWFPHLKNRKYLNEKRHFIPPRLRPEVVKVLKAHVKYLQGTPLWKGPETPLFTNEQGVKLANQNINIALKRASITGGVDPKKLVSTHSVRKAVGTMVAMNSQDPKRGAKVLNIDEKTFHSNYYQPNDEEDQDAMVDFLPDRAPKSLGIEDRVFDKRGDSQDPAPAAPVTPPPATPPTPPSQPA